MFYTGGRLLIYRTETGNGDLAIVVRQSSKQFDAVMRSCERSPSKRREKLTCQASVRVPGHPPHQNEGQAPRSKLAPCNGQLRVSLR